MSRSYTAEAIILKRTNFDEADKIITFLSKYKGKFTAIAKGVRKIASRRSPNLELFNKVKGHFASGRNLDVLTEVETVHTFKKIKESLEKTGSTFVLLEVTNGFLEEGQGGRLVFDLLDDSLSQIEAAKDSNSLKKALAAYEVKFLEKVGYKPELFTCVKCKGDLISEKLAISPELGGVLHSDCSENKLFTKPISSNILKALRFFQMEEPPRIERLKITKELAEDLEQTLKFYLEYLLERELKSSLFLKQVGEVSHLNT
ncbi:MAG: DNA repair protein RecO [Candidatus Woykebacteria bacterium RIFCSPLOWO2_01_FULL_41_12]|uniref:DNA repair protein RecO n=1 Tax=Candidatus Woykebacteria bacterium RIFCSPLOWO2_01_FULL_41_12 TaxID=1802604 RepID=A0A1G1WXC0_9BACT|nr:MAG: DNA repair protein RecO [Candidatus Woykebacteria bacterium RIFCSPLOWO2_01_FULL_41_12]